jgi:hypothetical protein
VCVYDEEGGGIVALCCFESGLGGGGGGFFVEAGTVGRGLQNLGEVWDFAGGGGVQRDRVEAPQ